MDSPGPSAEVKAVGGDDRDLEPGQKVGEYVVEAKIGAGGFGTVFRGAHPLIGKLVAIKVLKRQYSADPEMVSRFVAEARAVNQIRHRNIIDIFAFGALEDGRHYYVMELLDGVPLDEYLDSVGRVPLGEAVPILRAMARALDAAHAKGIAHRDLKPENIFLARDPDGQVFPKLLDFGIAKLLGTTASTSMHKTRTGAPIGTPYYMSPEQCRGRDVDHRTDIYAFGVVAFKLLTGVVPFDGEDYMDILLKQIGEPPPTPSSVNEDLPASVDQGILWMLAKDPSERPPNLVTAVRALEDAATAAGVDVERAQPSGVYASPTTFARAQVTPSGVKPVPARPSAKSNPSLGSAATIDPSGLPGQGRADLDGADAERGAPRRRAPLGIVLAALGALAVGTIVFFVVKSGRGADRGEHGSAVAPSTPSAPAASAPAAPTPAPPSTITLTIRGTPPETTVTGPGGRLLGVAPGPIQIDRSDQPVVLTFSADGYLPRSQPVSATADAPIDVTLDKRSSQPAGAGAASAASKSSPTTGAKPHGAGSGGSHGAHPPAGSGSGGRDTIEDPFHTGGT